MAWIVPAVGMAAGVTGTIAQGHNASKAAAEQAAAAEAALAEQTSLIEGAQSDITQAASDARGAYDEYGQAGIGTLGQGFGYADDAASSAAGSIRQGAASSQSALGRGLRESQGSLDQGLSAAGGTLGGLGELGMGFVPGATTSVGGPNARSRMGEMFDGGFNFEADPGYQFRLQQGQDAIGNFSSAEGGRSSGKTMKALQEHGQNFASNEYQNAFGRQAGLAQGADAFGLQQAGMGQQAALAAQRNQMGLAGMGFGAMQNFGGMQFGAGSQMAGLGGAAYGQMGSDRMAGAGALAGIQGSLSGQQLGLLGQQAGMYGTMGQQAGDTYTDAASTNAALTGQLAGYQTDPVALAGGETAAWANAYGDIAEAGYGAGSSLSDGAATAAANA